MDEEQRLKLKDMIKVNDTKDFTAKIRKLKHSSLIRDDVQTYLDLCKKYPKSLNERFFKEMCDKKCSFLVQNYTDIYIKLIKKELDLNILASLLNVLKDIEDGKMDQHEASFKVGKVLKELYIDTALRKGAKIDAAEERKKNKDKNKLVKKPKKISYSDFKRRELSEK